MTLVFKKIRAWKMRVIRSSNSLTKEMWKLTDNLTKNVVLVWKSLKRKILLTKRPLKSSTTRIAITKCIAAKIHLILRMSLKTLWELMKLKWSTIHSKKTSSSLAISIWPRCLQKTWQQTLKSQIKPKCSKLVWVHIWINLLIVSQIEIFLWCASKREKNSSDSILSTNRYLNKKRALALFKRVERQPKLWRIKSQ